MREHSTCQKYMPEDMSDGRRQNTDRHTQVDRTHVGLRANALKSVLGRCGDHSK